jgi:hypothetical protein
MDPRAPSERTEPAARQVAIMTNPVGTPDIPAESWCRDGPRRWRDKNGSDGMSPFALIVTRGSRGAPQPRPPSLRLQTAATSRHSRSHAA